jgi:putative glutamine amidotransferase
VRSLPQDPPDEPNIPHRGHATRHTVPVQPLIGITCYVERTRWGVWDTTTALLPHGYVTQVEDAGALAVILPPRTSASRDVLDRLDGLVIAGGADVDPGRYGEPVHPETLGLRPDRDAGEFALLGEALRRDLPVLGICRGMQVMAVHAGGRLIQHLPDEVGHTGHRPAPGEYGSHGARFAPGSLVATLLGEKATVNSYHHQGVADPGTLTVTGWADDGSVEAVEDPTRRFAVGVQWHPESTEDNRLFAGLVAAARGGRPLR